MDSENLEDAAQLSSPAGSGSTDYVFQDKLTVKGNKILRVKLVGKHGKNKFRRDFSKIKWSEHLPLYVDASLNINHTEDRWRSFEGRIGWVEKPREIGGELYGDLVLNEAHPWTATLIWWAKNKPNKVGVSQDFFYDFIVQPDGSQLVTKIHKVNGIDVVADPSATNGLEAVETGKQSKGNAGKVDPTLPGQKVPEPPKGSTGEAVGAGSNPEPNDPDGDGVEEYAPDDMPEFDPLNPDQPNYIMQIGELVSAIICDAALSAEEKKKKVLISLKLLEDSAGEEIEAVPAESEDEPDPEDPNEDEEMAKGEEALELKTKLDEALAQLKVFQEKEQKAAAKEASRKLCTERGLEAADQDDWLLDTLSGKTVEEQQTIIDRFKSKIKTAKGTESLENPVVVSTPRGVPNPAREMPPIDKLFKDAGLTK